MAFGQFLLGSWSWSWLSCEVALKHYNDFISLCSNNRITTKNRSTLTSQALGSKNSITTKDTD